MGRRTAVAFCAVALLTLVVAACTPDVQSSEATSIVEDELASVTVATHTPTLTPTIDNENDDANPQVGSPTEFACETPSTEIVDYVNQLIATPRVGTLASSDIASVLVGAGNDQNEQWWIVAANENDRDYHLDNFVFLTNAPGYDTVNDSVLWIRVNAYPGWDAVHWPTEKIFRGQLAQAFAVSCLQ